MRTVADSYSIARALIADPRTSWGNIPQAETTMLRRLLRDLVAEVDWQRTRADLADMPCTVCGPVDGRPA